MLLIGSRAARHHFANFRDPKDWDLLATRDELIEWVRKNKGNILYRQQAPAVEDIKPNSVLKHRFKLKTREMIEVEIATTTNSAGAFRAANDRQPEVDVPGGRARVAMATTLKAIKRSHVHQPVHWQKNINDYHFLKSKTGDLSPFEQTALDMRIIEVDSRCNKKRRINLNKSNDEFFAQSEKAVGRVYVHDDLHLATCYYDRPIYETIKDDLSKAILNKRLFYQLPQLDKIRLVQEEGYAIALERWIISGVETQGPVAFGNAIRRICTDLTKGWFRDFAIENYPEVIDTQKDFLRDFEHAVQSGTIQPISQEVEVSSG